MVAISPNRGRWNDLYSNAVTAPKGVPVAVSSIDFGERSVVATYEGLDDFGEPIWLFETEDGPIRISVQGWRQRGLQ